MKWIFKLMEACGLCSCAIVEDGEIEHYGKRVKARTKKGRFKKVRKSKSKVIITTEKEN